MNILTINLALSTLVFWIAARLYVLPKLQDYEARAILLPILLLHSLRHLGRPLRDRRKAVFLSHSHRPGCPLLTQSGHQLQYVPNSFKCDILIRPAALPGRGHARPGTHHASWRRCRHLANRRAARSKRRKGPAWACS